MLEEQKEAFAALVALTAGGTGYESAGCFSVPMLALLSKAARKEGAQRLAAGARFTGAGLLPHTSAAWRSPVAVAAKETVPGSTPPSSSTAAWRSPDAVAAEEAVLGSRPSACAAAVWGSLLPNGTGTLTGSVRDLARDDVAACMGAFIPSAWAAAPDGGSNDAARRGVPDMGSRRVLAASTRAAAEDLVVTGATAALSGGSWGPPESPSAATKGAMSSSVSPFGCALSGASSMSESASAAIAAPVCGCEGLKPVISAIA